MACRRAVLEVGAVAAGGPHGRPGGGHARLHVPVVRGALRARGAGHRAARLGAGLPDGASPPATLTLLKPYPPPGHGTAWLRARLPGGALPPQGGAGTYRGDHTTQAAKRHHSARASFGHVSCCMSRACIAIFAVPAAKGPACP